MDEGIRTTLSDGVLRVEIHRPGKRNALTTAMYAALGDALARAHGSPGIRVVLLHGQREAFTSGNDLKDFLEHPAEDPGHPAFRFVDAISHCAAPIVAAVNGPCVGIGVTMLLHCDLVYAGEGATFGLPFVNLGLCPENGSSLLLPLVAGLARANELLMLGETFSAARAEQCGIVSAVLKDDEALPHAERQARKLADKPPQALRVTKSLVRRGFRAMLDEAIGVESEQFRRQLVSAEAKEAFAAFLEKRKPDFSRAR